MKKNIQDFNLCSNAHSIGENSIILDPQTICHVLKTNERYVLKKYSEYRENCNNFKESDRRILLDWFVFQKGQTKLSDEILIEINISNEHFSLNINKYDYNIYLEKERKLTHKIDKLKSQHPTFSIERINKLIAYKSSILNVYVELMVSSKKQVCKRYDIDLSIKKDKHYYRRGLILLKAKMNYYKQAFPEFSDNRLYCLVSFSYFY